MEEKFGPYKMLSSVFEYQDLRNEENFQFVKFKDALYRGQIKDVDKREGKGIMVYESGRIYEGFWVADRRQGPGFEKYS